MRALCLFLVALAALAARATDLDEGDPRCNIRVAIATTLDSHKPPKDMLKLQKRLRDHSIKTQLALLDRAPDLKHHTFTDWFLTAYPEDVAGARRLVEEARARGLRVEHPSAESDVPFR